MKFVDLATNSESEGGGVDLSAEVAQLQAVEIRHGRVIIINPAVGSGTLTLPVHVSAATGYEAGCSLYAVIEGNLIPGLPVFSTNNPQVPLAVEFNPSTLAFTVIDPTSGPVTPADPFGLIVRCKVATQYWDNDATDLA